MTTAFERAIEIAGQFDEREAFARWLSEISASPFAAEPQQGNVFDIRDGSECQPDPDLQVFEYWQRVMEKPTARFHPKRKNLIRRRRSEGYSTAELMAAIDGCRASPWHQGENPNGIAYNSLELIFRDCARLEQFQEIANRPPSPRAASPSKFGAETRAAQVRDELDAFKRGSDE